MSEIVKKKLFLFYGQSMGYRRGTGESPLARFDVTLCNEADDEALRDFVLVSSSG